jgi:hypothetical protein
LILSEYNWTKVTGADIAFPNFNTTQEFVAEAESRNLKKGRDKFDELFFKGGKVSLKDDVKGTWKESAWLFCKVLMGSFAPKHENKESVCAMIIEECLEL